MHDPETTDAERIQITVDSKYCPADLRNITDECALLNVDEKEFVYITKQV